MSKPSRRPSRRARAHRNGSDPGPVAGAIDKAAALRAPVEMTLLIHRKPMRLKPTERVAVKPLSNPNEAPLLIRGADGLWHGVILPPGSTFELRPSGPGAQLWTPPK